MRLASALLISSLLHLPLLVPMPWPSAAPARPPIAERLQARILDAPPPVLLAPEVGAPTQDAPIAPPAIKTLASRAGRSATTIVERPSDPVSDATRQIVRHLLYPPEAIAQGLEGETLVMLFFDDDGRALTARVERSSGHAILDDAAVRAARQVKAVPDGMAREIVLPVRFRLR